MAEIQVYASLPHVVTLGPQLDISPANWHWVHCLTFPVDTLNKFQFSLKPYKWMRYAAGVVVGAEGDLLSSPDSPNAVDYNAGLPSEPVTQVLFYHTSDAEKRRMFPADPQIGHSRITSSDATTLREHFYDGVAERDGRECLLSGLGETFCEAVHLIAHSKGDAYISTYTRRRSRDPTGGDIVEEVDSMRNGLFLNTFTHITLVDTNDIDPTAPSSEIRYSAHLFQPVRGALGDVTLSSGAPLRISDNPGYPPAILFDAVYACAILSHFGTKTLKDNLVKHWKDNFYPNGIKTAAQADYKAITDQREAAANSTETAAFDCQARQDARTAPDSFDMLWYVPYALVPEDQMQTMLKDEEEKAKAMEQQRVHEKVSSWIKQI